MVIILKAIGIAIIAIVLSLFVAKQNKEMAVLISIAACCVILLYAVNYLEPVLVLINDLKDMGNLDGSFLEILLKSVGIGLFAEITALLCADSGNTAVGKTVQIVAICGIIWAALPLFASFFDILNSILGDI